MTGRSLFDELKLVAASFVTAAVIASMLMMPSAVQAAGSESGVLGSSAQTVKASDYDLEYNTAPMPDLQVTVSQTKNLTSQGIMVSWSGGKQSVRASTTGGENFLQIFQCWGEDPNNPGHPDRTTCQYGGVGGPGAMRDNNTETSHVDPMDELFTLPGKGWSSPPMTAIPFKAVTGEEIWTLKKNPDGSLAKNDVSSGSNQFFSAQTTNEITWAGSGAEGTGVSRFELQTASQSPGLGCGNASKVNGKFVGQPCWIVALPRGTADNGQESITQSGLFWDAWKHHIAFKLDFRPIGVRCDIGVPEKQVQGTELIGSAFSAWQPKLCGGEVKTAFVISNQTDADALSSAESQTSSPLAVTTSAANGEKSDPLVYAPLAAAGVSITFSIDRKVTQAIQVPADVVARDQTPFTSLKLNQRLLAKLLTASYIEALPPGADISYVEGNPRNLTKDPEFLALNSDEPDWQYMDLAGPGLADLLVPNTRSFLAQQVWRYVLSDPSAVAFMAGIPDEYGMKVNKWYCTDAEKNPNKAGFNALGLSFPKSDPVEKPDTTNTGSTGSGPINLVAWRPYLSDFEATAKATLQGNAYELGAWNNMGTPPGFQKPVRDLPGKHKILAISTTPSANQFQAFQASLRNSAGNFVRPTLASLTSAVASMSPGAQNKYVYELDYSSKKVAETPDLYPLTAVVYGAINPRQSDSVSRLAYANLIRFAVQDGQTPGDEAGQLPAGYAPLSSAFIKQSLSVADSIADGDSSSGNPEPEKDAPSSVSTEQPMPQPVIAAGVTPENPSAPITSASIPFTFVLFVCAFTIYGLLRNRKSRI